MNVLLSVRGEIVCLIILISLLMHSKAHQPGEDRKSCFRLYIFALFHVIFHIFTVLTFGSDADAPSFVPWAIQTLYSLSSVLFAYEFFCYTAELCMKKDALQKLRRVAFALPVFCLLALPFLGFEAAKNEEAMRVSLAYTLCIGAALIFFAGTAVLIGKFYSLLSDRIKQTLIPVLGLLIAAVVILLTVPGLSLITCAVTVAAFFIFFVLESPTEILRRKAQTDDMSGIKSRHSYEMDILDMERSYNRNVPGDYTVVFCDLSNLRNVNNFHGYMAGDNYIGTVAHILINEMKNAARIYRMGGEEFMVVYHNVPEEMVKREIARVQSVCDSKQNQRSYRITVVMGYAVSGPEHPTVRDVLKAADYNMYANKADLKWHNAYKNGKDAASGITDSTTDQ